MSIQLGTALFRCDLVAPGLAMMCRQRRLPYVFSRHVAISSRPLLILDRDRVQVSAYVSSGRGRGIMVSRQGDIRRLPNIYVTMPG